MIIYEEILRDFQKHKVKYVLVGGIAFNLLGGMRNTADLDILVEMTDVNLAKIVKILSKRGYSVKQPVDPMGIADKETRRIWIKDKHMKAFNFYKEEVLKEVDLIIESPVSFETAKKNASIVRIGAMRLPVISIDDLIKMKKKAARDIDLIDVEDLKSIKRLKRKI
jgi:hypothetical protein